MSEIEQNRRNERNHQRSVPLLKSSMLRPSVFQTNNQPENTNTNTSANDGNNIANKTISVNPFLKAVTEDEDDAAAEDNNTLKTEDAKLDPLSLLTKNGLPKSNLFEAAKTAASSLGKSDNHGFVFGQNVHERVLTDKSAPAPSSEASTTQNAETSTDNQSDNHKNESELLFSNVVQQAAENKSTTDATEPDNKEKKSLTEVAREYEESRVQKRKYEKVETFTGEESETNILDVHGKIFAFVGGTWEERGRGSMRLNDASDGSQTYSRVVFRTSGNLRVLFNTKIWAGMVAERPSPKSLRLTAMDTAEQIKIFLMMARPEDIDKLFAAMTKRVKQEQLKVPVEEVVAISVDETVASNVVIEEKDSEDEPVHKKPNLEVENEEKS